MQLEYGRATLRDVKARSGDEKDRIVDLEPRAIVALAGLPGQKQAGRVFRRKDGSVWHPDPKVAGAQLNRAFQAIAKEACGAAIRTGMRVNQDKNGRLCFP